MMSVSARAKPPRSRVASVSAPPRLDIGPGLASLVFFALSIVYFLPAFLPDRHIFGTDYLAGGYFFFEFVSDRLAAGELPKWVPYVYGGLPLLSNPGSTFYPIRLLADVLLPVTWILPFIFVVQFGIAGLGMYLLARELGCRSWVALLAGLAFEFTGITISSVFAGQDGRVIVATFAPLLFFFLHRGIRTGRVGPFVGAAATTGFSLLSFQIQSNYYLLIAGLIWAVFSLVHLGYHRDMAALGRRVALGLVAVAFGFSLAAVNFLPFIDYVDDSPRGGVGGRGYEYSIGFSMPPAELISVAVPEAPGILDNYQGDNPFKLHTEYLGALVVVLLVLGVRFSRRDRYWLFFAGLALFTLTIAFGGNTPFYRLYYDFLPGTSRFRAPAISFFLFSLSAVAMAAVTLEKMALAKEDHATARRHDSSPEANLGVWFIGIGGVAVAALAFVAASGGGEPTDAARVAGFGRFALFASLTCGALWLWFRERLRDLGIVLILAVVTVIDLWIVDRNFFDTVPPPDQTFAADDVVNFLRSQPGPYRTWVLPIPEAYRGHGNYLMLFDIEQAGGEHGNQLQRYNEFAGAGEEVYVDWSNYLESENFLRAANIRYIVSMTELQTPFLREAHRGSALVYENLNALPRAYLVEEVRTSADTAAALTALEDPTFDPSRTAVVYSAEPLDLPSGPLEGSAEVVESSPDRVVVRTASNREALLVLADNYFDGWTARVNGTPATIERTNHTFRGVVVPEGESEVVFEFRPRDLYVGFYVYLAGMLLLVGYGIWLLARRGRQRVAPAG
ncbi:MAG: YfhO family protein [Gemmatimonas sp.]|nr:YfhO family protein [Gemmatimonas sp.]